VTGVLACGSSGSIRSCPLAAATSNPMHATQSKAATASFGKVCTGLFLLWFCFIDVDRPTSWLEVLFSGNLLVGKCCRDSASVGFCGATTEVIGADPFEVLSPPPRRINDDDLLKAESSRDVLRWPPLRSG